jgi:hypothetical protein
MYKLFPGKTPMRMRIEAEQGCVRRLAAPTGEVDPAQRPVLHSDSPDELDATLDWLAHLDAGRISIR